MGRCGGRERHGGMRSRGVSMEIMSLAVRKGGIIPYLVRMQCIRFDVAWID